jgi:hypothetical protein
MMYSPEPFGRGTGGVCIADGAIGDDELALPQPVSAIAETNDRNLVDDRIAMALSLLSRKRERAVRT